MKRKEKETFLESRPQHDNFEYLLANQFLTEASDEGKIKKLKKVFGLAVEYRNDEAALKLLTLIDKAIYEKERRIAEGPGGDGHLGRAYGRAKRQLYDYLMEMYWQLPDMKPDRHDCRDIMCPTMLQTKFWILEEVILNWQPEEQGAVRTFQFLIAAYEPLSKDWQTPVENAEFKIKSKGRWVSQEERGEILKLIRRQNTRFKSGEIEKWIKQPWIPHEFEKILAIARTRNGGPKLWQDDIRNAELLKLFSPDERTEAAINLFQRECKIIAEIDQKVQKLINQMTSEDYSGREEIGGSEYVLGKRGIIYNTIFEIIIHIKLRPDCPEALVRDNFGRAKRHIKKWLKENHFRKVTLNMRIEGTDFKLNGEFYGDHHHLAKKG
ncbi:MAG: hypothetical protein HQ537_00070 [Parcubacteria group bacterium]|nr:hypothetical protein [Parcubacteria group bacterium]